MTKTKGKIRAARLDRSARLQSIFWLLADGREHDTWEVIQRCRRAAVNSAMAELRAAQFYRWRRLLQAQHKAPVEASHG